VAGGRLLTLQRGFDDRSRISHLKDARSNPSSPSAATFPHAASSCPSPPTPRPAPSNATRANVPALAPPPPRRLPLARRLHHRLDPGHYRRGEPLRARFKPIPDIEAATRLTRFYARFRGIPRGCAGFRAATSRKPQIPRRIRGLFEAPWGHLHFQTRCALERTLLLFVPRVVVRGVRWPRDATRDRPQRPFLSAEGTQLNSRHASERFAREAAGCDRRGSPALKGLCW
jgi:hypothetical protein